MKILLIMASTTGVEYHRLVKPMTRAQLDSDAGIINKIDLYLAQDIIAEGVPDLRQFDLVVFNRYLYKYHDRIIEYLCKHHIPYVVDIDDYWKLPKGHVSQKFYKQNKVTEAVINAMRYADGVTCSTETLAKYVRPINHKVCILPNALDLTDEQWNYPKAKNERFTFGYAAGVSHQDDCTIVGEAIHHMMDMGCDVVYIGYDPKNHICKSMYNRLNIGKEQRVKVMQGTSPNDYGKLISMMDAMIAPLWDTPYNNCKSDIKAQEAQAYGIPLVASNCYPYLEKVQILCNNTTESWIKGMTEAMTYKPNMKFKTIEEVNEKRLKFYANCIQKAVDN